MSAERLMDDGMCFACGRLNPGGLGLRFAFDGREASAPVTFGERFQGYRGIVHGGLVSTALDEAMVTVLNRAGDMSLTADLCVRFLAPARVGEPLRVAATLVSRRGRVSRLEARLMREDGTELARAVGTYFRTGSLPGADRVPEGRRP